MPTIADIKKANQAIGHHWFDPVTMHFFGTRVSQRVHEGPGGTYFVTSEQPPQGSRCYTIRRVMLSGQIETVGFLGAHTSLSRAHRAAEFLATISISELPSKRFGHEQCTSYDCDARALFDELDDAEEYPHSLCAECLVYYLPTSLRGSSWHERLT